MSSPTPSAAHRITINLYPVQHEFIHSPATFRGFVGGRGAGKALALDTPILTVSGWSTMGEIRVNDQLFDESGNQCRVTGVTPVQYQRPCYEVEFSDGTRIVADAQHEWVTHTKVYRKSLGRRRKVRTDTRPLPQCQPRHKPTIVTTEEIAKTLHYDKRGEANHAVPIALPLNTPEVALPVRPYTLGAWLGDGTSIRSQITSADPEVLDNIRSDGYEVQVLDSTADNNAPTFAIFTPGVRRTRDECGRLASHPDNLLVRLRLMGVVDDKHIPEAYLRASLQQRRELLQGLMDTDGTADGKGRCEFTNTNRRVADGFLELCRSIGIQANLTEGRATLYGVDHGPKYRIHFTPYMNVFRIPRKSNRLHVKGAQGSRREYRYIKAVTPVESVPVRCIQVDSPNHLYLASRALVPTHNSFVGSYDLLRKAKPNRLYMVVAPTYKILKDASFRSFADHARQLKFLKKLNLADLRVTLGNDAEVLFRSAENPDSLRGPNISGCWMDEASYCHEDAYSIVIACLREAGEQGWLSATFTPKGKAHWTYKILGKNIECRRKNAEAAARGDAPTEKLDKNVELFTAKTKDNPFLPPEFEHILRSQYTSTMASQELEGSFLDVGGKTFNRAWFTQLLKVPPAQARWVRYWDKAATQDGGCHTCGVLMGADYTGRFYVADIVRGQWSTFQREEIIKLTAQMDAQKFHHQVRIYVEQEPGSGGVDSLRATVKLLAGFPVFPDKPSKDKRVRAEPFAAQAEAGNVIMIEPPGTRNWLAAYLDELEAFPEGDADQVDASSGAFNKLIEGNASVPVATSAAATAGLSPDAVNGSAGASSTLGKPQQAGGGGGGFIGQGTGRGGGGGGGFIGFPGAAPQANRPSQGSGGFIGFPGKGG